MKEEAMGIEREALFTVSAGVRNCVRHSANSLNPLCMPLKTCTKGNKNSLCWVPAVTQTVSCVLLYLSVIPASCGHKNKPNLGRPSHLPVFPKSIPGRVVVCLPLNPKPRQEPGQGEMRKVTMVGKGIIESDWLVKWEERSPDFR